MTGQHMTGQSRQDSHDRTATTGQHMTGQLRIGYSHKRTAMTGQNQNRNDKTIMTGQLLKGQP